MKLNIVGNVFGMDGYSSHTRHLFNALSKNKELDIKLSTQLPPNWVQLSNDAELSSITKPERKEDWNLIITLPQMWKLFLGLGKNACYCVWEGDKVPQSWLDDFQNERVNLILVPSQHTYNAVMNTWKELYNDEAIKDKLRIIPHGVDRSIFYKIK